MVNEKSIKGAGAFQREGGDMEAGGGELLLTGGENSVGVLQDEAADKKEGTVDVGVAGSGEE